MRRTSVFVTIAFLAGLGVGFFAGSAYPGMLQRRTHGADLAAIEKLERADVEATLTQDPSLLINLWSDDGVKLDVPGPPVVGKKAIQELYQKARTVYPEFKVLKYAPDFKDVQIADGWALEWGYFEAMYKMSAKDNPVNVKGKGARVLKRQSDGSWKLAVVGLK
ncbi:MAG TPA: nuclear transport factor 2 family protein [Candidatus Acidoferrum sp.]|nr:nuclear transport factor 2 family protein [Candidatus Acidoferrum sp.]